MKPLPIDAALPPLRYALSEHSTVVLQAPPGAGKTTQVPLALLDEPWLAGQSILILEPRRLAARSAAVYMAAQLGEAVGRTVGYRVRFDNRVCANTRIEVVTEGILTRRLQQDPELEGVGLVIFDEFHERHLQSDLGLALCLDAQQGLREDLRLLIMSATLDGEGLAGKLSAPLVVSEGRSYPVEYVYLQRDESVALPELARRGVLRALGEQRGDILVFLPGEGEIRRTVELLEAEPACQQLQFHPLYGRLDQQAQQRAIQPDPDGQRKVVLATPIAETSLTIEGVSVVVDSGWRRAPRFDPRRGLGRLETLRISRAAAEQRAGRAGRLGPGICYRLWSKQSQQGLIPFEPPEIVVSDLTPLALELAAWGVSDVQQLFWLDCPPLATLRASRELLGELGALDGQGRITPHGEAMARLPLHPRLAHMLLVAKRLGLAGTACDIAALISERDVLREREHERRCDFTLRLELLHRFRDQGRAGARAAGGEQSALAAAERAAGQYRRILGLDTGAGSLPADESVGLLLALAYPDRVAQARTSGARQYRLAAGSGARLPRECPSPAGELLVAAELDGKGGEGLIRTAAPLSQADLEEQFAPIIRWQERVDWDARQEVVVTRKEQRYLSLVLKSRPLDRPEAEQLQEAMLEGVRQMGLDALPWDETTRQLQARILSLRHWQAEGGWPDLSEQALAESLDTWLAPYLAGITRREHLASLDLHGALLARLDWQQQQWLDELAPSHWTVPSGSRKKLQYSADGASPVLAVKLQEMFGQLDTPRIAGGRVALMVHLLSPAQRPVQVTQDLKGFWERTYPEVKKELKGRYPKHPWPDDPWQAEATAGVKRRPR